MISDEFYWKDISKVYRKDSLNEKDFTDLCKSYLMLGSSVDGYFLHVCEPYLVNAASEKEENKEIQKEVEMALLALSAVEQWDVARPQASHLNDTIEIIKYHQEHHNLTRLGYQSAWKYLNNRYYFDFELGEVVSDELHFMREAARELDELARCVDWKRKEGDKREREREEEYVLLRWLLTLEHFLRVCFVQNEEYVGLIGSIMSVFRASRDKNKNISFLCILSLEHSAKKRFVRIDYLLSLGVFDSFLEEIQRSTMDDEMAGEFLEFFESISRRLKGKGDDEMEEAKRKTTKRKTFEWMEEEGLESIIINFHEEIDFFNKRNHHLSLDVTDYFVNA
ncbi:uncharacterized protein MONOS_18693 [Monocercomonoides exilis]|uniref:uncharacterized protein n=1 Tax=Monocercomonoides exilis TaxID=2049356 RepID=UPI00355A0793|nr:hypothetical protein MONOS_18693 [Monocercomonoides exilis]